MGDRAEEDGGEEEGGGEGVEGGEVHWGRGGCIYGEVGGIERWTGRVGKVAYMGFTERGVLSIQSICVVVDSHEGLFRFGMKFGLMYIKD